MESSSKIYGDFAEECHSSESGWTMYIGSSMEDDADAEAGAGDGGRRKKGVSEEDEDEDTDDSMASDASSGPSQLHLQQPWKGAEVDDDVKYKCSSKKNKKGAAVKKKGGCEEEGRKKKEENEKRGRVNTVQSGNRAWFKRK